MRFAVIATAILTLFGTAPTAYAQAYPSDQQGQRGRSPQQQQEDNGGRRRAPRLAPLRNRANVGPCPYVKILYDAARYVEMADNRPAAANVGFTGEIQGVASNCAYRDDDPITVEMDVRFDLGRGPQATDDKRTYRYWIAVTERNRAVLAKEYFDLPVDFRGARTATVTEERTIVIPRAEATTSGDNFEILVGFDVTPEMAAFNRSGSRFRINAGQQVPLPSATQ